VLAHVEALPGGALCFSVPVGHTYVVKSVTWYQDQLVGAAAIRLSESVANEFWYANGMPVTRYAGLNEEMSQVFEAGMSVEAWATLPTTIVRLSGFDLIA
jgi:hypothetical protein